MVAAVDLIGDAGVTMAATPSAYWACPPAWESAEIPAAAAAAAAAAVASEPASRSDTAAEGCPAEAEMPHRRRPCQEEEEEGSCRPSWSPAVALAAVASSSADAVAGSDWRDAATGIPDDCPAAAGTAVD